MNGTAGVVFKNAAYLRSRRFLLLFFLKFVQVFIVFWFFFKDVYVSIPLLFGAVVNDTVFLLFLHVLASL